MTTSTTPHVHHVMYLAVNRRYSRSMVVLVTWRQATCWAARRDARMGPTTGMADSHPLCGAGPLPASRCEEPVRGVPSAQDGVAVCPTGGGPHPGITPRRPARGLPPGHEDHYRAGIPPVHREMHHVVDMGDRAGRPSAPPLDDDPEDEDDTRATLDPPS